MGKIRKAAALLLLLLACSVHVQAVDTGSVTVIMPAAGGSVMLHFVADVTEEGETVLAETFAASGVILTDLHDPKAAEQLAEFARQEALPGTTRQIDQDGSAVFTGLQKGLYLVTQQETTQGQLPICPFLVVIPESGNYAVEARPKNQPEPEPTQPDSTTPETGDRSMVLLIPAVACMLFSGLGAGLCLYLYKDRRS